ncbi:MAG: substrate-binding domain-containing protein [Verrucomicrobiales bacterium]|nr:substrate-binding domain-containing protein [Verrucomicrobiales bacterium]
MPRRLLALVCFAIASAIIALLWLRSGSDSAATSSLTVYCAAGLKKPVEAIANAYREELGVEVNLQYGGTGTLLSQIEVAKRGDLFIAADDGSLSDAGKRQLIAESLPLAVQRPVIAVKSGNSKGILTLSDLSRDDVRLALANPEAASISKVSKKLLGDTWDGLAAKAAVMKPTVTELAADLQLGAVDAAIVWDATVRQFDGLAAVDLPELSQHRENASAAVLSACQDPSAALRFARYLAAPDRGGRIFEAHGFTPAGGDAWAERPSLVLYSGGVNRLAIEPVLKEFADRENVELTTVYNGCGILCAAMKAMTDTANPKFPDVYYACDVCFVAPVAEQFPEAVLLTETAIVIAVPEGNPAGIKTLADLARDGLRVGLCNAEQSTLGFMTTAMLRQTGLLDSVRKNVAVEVPTADFLVNQMRAGSLDAIIVYEVNVAPHPTLFDSIALPEEFSKAIQPFAVRKDSPNARLAGRLLAFLSSRSAVFESAGFRWRGDEQAIPSDRLDVPPWLKP